MRMSLQKKASEQVVMASLRCAIALPLSLFAIPSVICLALFFPASVSAHTDLLRTAPTKGAILSTAPAQARLWFSAVVNPTFSTAIVENEAHEYVNTRDASFSPRDAREMDILLSPHLPPGVYTVVWRAASDSDGLILSGAYSFVIVQAGEMVPRQNSPTARPFPGQFDSLAHTLLLIGTLVGVVILLFCLLRSVIVENSGQSLTRQPVYQYLERGAALCKKKSGLYFTHVLRWESIVGIVALIYLGLGLVQGAPGVFSPTRTLPATRSPLQQDTMSALTSFHAAARTTDKRFIIVLDITTSRCCASTFALSVRDASTGKSMANVSLMIFKTMLDMRMGTDTVSARPDGKGGFSAQSDLSMGGLWQICIGIRTTDHTPHEACVKVLIAY
jgi:methionine-rich copper-binding protein CopC